MDSAQLLHCKCTGTWSLQRPALLGGTISTALLIQETDLPENSITSVAPGSSAMLRHPYRRRPLQRGHCGNLCLYSWPCSHPLIYSLETVISINARGTHRCFPNCLSNIDWLLDNTALPSSLSRFGLLILMSGWKLKSAVNPEMFWCSVFPL